MQQKLDISSLADSECIEDISSLQKYFEQQTASLPSTLKRGTNIYQFFQITDYQPSTTTSICAIPHFSKYLHHHISGEYIVSAPLSGSHITDGIDTLVKFSTRVLKLKVKCSTVPLNKAPALLGEVFKCIEYLQARYDFPQNRSDRHPVAKIDEHDLEVESGASCGGSDSDNGLTQEDLE
ncbi:hypothetical protein BLNAU_23087 [Blattamonas nauphoetae]|uniref:Uncharacterized protein n=1 Tax=Blattamonas nauphoetae TaxID=2049346 RepID=A0ABQ9WRQ4_9EUKA|nr:hypothetical protein BLNAU_23087 [Blattamonas nauphoetae]